jgi:hypothetical protein
LLFHRAFLDAGMSKPIHTWREFGVTNALHLYAGNLGNTRKISKSQLRRRLKTSWEAAVLPLNYARDWSQPSPSRLHHAYANTGIAIKTNPQPA